VNLDFVYGFHQIKFTDSAVYNP